MRVADWLTGADREVAWRGDQTLMLSTMRRQVLALSQRLAAEAGTHWALCFDDSYRFCVALLASWYAGKTPVMPGHARAALLDEMQDRLDGVLCDMPLAVSLPRLAWDEAEAQGALPPLPDGAELVLFTSGSTGTPRQVVKSLAVMEQESRWLCALWGDCFGQPSAPVRFIVPDLPADDAGAPVRRPAAVLRRTAGSASAPLALCLYQQSRFFIAAGQVAADARL